MRRLHDEMMAFYAARHRLAYYKRNQAIHAAIAALSGNTLLGRPTRASKHEAMIAALEARDADRLVAVIARHLDATWDRVQDLL